MLFDRLRAWRARRAQRHAAHAALDELFASPEVLGRSSLRPDQRGRADLVDFEPLVGPIEIVRFRMIRHPRPYAFSKQFHEVLELYEYRVSERTVTVIDSVNLTRARDEDGGGSL